ncbi:MAG: hypothetical protein IPL92_12295 [Saprospiraceae bacterium]|nr:hypothetical protein [Candidatus Opimibacter iunctus]
MSLLYDRYADSLFGVVSRILGDDQIAEDILQKTMLKIWNGIDGFDPSKGLLFYLDECDRPKYRPGPEAAEDISGQAKNYFGR